MVLLAGVAIYWVVTWWWLPDFALQRWFDPAEDAGLPTAVASLALGVAGAASMVGGFAGVVVVFGLSSNDERFRTVRLEAATSLRRNWMSVVTTPLAAAFGALVAAGMATAEMTDHALWVLMACLVLAAHGAVRLVILLGGLVTVVHRADEALDASSANVGAAKRPGAMPTRDFYGDRLK